MRTSAAAVDRATVVIHASHDQRERHVIHSHLDFISALTRIPTITASDDWMVDETIIGSGSTSATASTEVISAVVSPTIKIVLPAAVPTAETVRKLRKLVHHHRDRLARLEREMQGKDFAEKVPAVVQEKKR